MHPPNIKVMNDSDLPADQIVWLKTGSDNITIVNINDEDITASNVKYTDSPTVENLSLNPGKYDITLHYKTWTIDQLYKVTIDAKPGETYTAKVKINSKNESQVTLNEKSLLLLDDAFTDTATEEDFLAEEAINKKSESQVILQKKTTPKRSSDCKNSEDGGFFIEALYAPDLLENVDYYGLSFGVYGNTNNCLLKIYGMINGSGVTIDQGSDKKTRSNMFIGGGIALNYVISPYIEVAIDPFDYIEKFADAVIINGILDSDCDEIFGCSFEDPSDYIKIGIKANYDNFSLGLYRMKIQVPEKLNSKPISGYVTGASFEYRF